jgi:hypothetical protein
VHAQVVINNREANPVSFRERLLALSHPVNPPFVANPESTTDISHTVLIIHSA